MNRVCIVIVALACLLAYAGSSWARSIEVELTKVAVIRPSESSDELRLLVAFALPELLRGRSIDFACVSFGADCSGTEGGVSFQAFALSRDWNAETVSWEGCWEKAGGDWDDSSSAYWISEGGRGRTVHFDVTDFANVWLKQPAKNFGIIVKVSGPFFGTFSLNEFSGAPKLRILY